MGAAPAILEPEAPPVYGAALPEKIRELGREIFAPRVRLSPVEWAERYRRWPDGSPYRVDETPHVREVLEAYADPSIQEIVVKKPTQCGLTEGAILNLIGWHIDQDPRAILVVIPSVDEATKWSKKKLEASLIDCTPQLAGKLDDGSRKSTNTILEKAFPGGSIGIVGSNSPRGFRMVTVGTVFADDVDGWDPTAGKGEQSEGDQVTLIRRRTDRIPDRKRVWVSTPTRKGSRISRLYEETDRRGEWHVPCPHCGTYQVLRWGKPDTPYGLKWEKFSLEELGPDYQIAPGEVLRGRIVHRPDTAWYLCVNGCRIEEVDKVSMERRGQYLADDGKPVRQPGVRSIGLWIHGALSLSLPGAEWPALIREFLKAKDHLLALQAFTNTIFAEDWEDAGEAPDWQEIFDRREHYPIGTCPEGVVFLTAGVDVQQDYLVASVWGWGRDKESWLVDDVVIEGDLGQAHTRRQLTELLHRTYPTAAGGSLPIAGLAIDTGHDQEAVVGWAREVRDPRVMLVKGDHWKNWSVILGTPSKSEVTWKGQRTGLLLWPVGGAVIKQETYGFLRLGADREGEPSRIGRIHLPQVDEEFCRQLVAEKLVTRTDRWGFSVREWVKERHRNERLDTRVYARAAAERHGLSRLISTEPQPPQPKPQPPRRDDGERSGWLGRGRGGGRMGGRRRGGWLR